MKCNHHRIFPISSQTLHHSHSNTTYLLNINNNPQLYCSSLNSHNKTPHSQYIKAIFQNDLDWDFLLLSQLHQINCFLLKSSLSDCQSILLNDSSSLCTHSKYILIQFGLTFLNNPFSTVICKHLIFTNPMAIKNLCYRQI